MKTYGAIKCHKSFVELVPVLVDNADLFFQTRFSAKIFRTKFALKRALILVLDPDVLLQNTFKTKTPVTNVTLERPYLVVDELDMSV